MIKFIIRNNTKRFYNAHAVAQVDAQMINTRIVYFVRAGYIIDTKAHPSCADFERQHVATYATRQDAEHAAYDAIDGIANEVDFDVIEAYFYRYHVQQFKAA